MESKPQRLLRSTLTREELWLPSYREVLYPYRAVHYCWCIIHNP